MSIEYRYNPFQPHIESKTLSPKEISKTATSLLNSFEEYMRLMELQKKQFTEHRISEGWEWLVEFNPGKTKNNRSLLIKRREENSEALFSRIVVDQHNISFFEPDRDPIKASSYILSPNNHNAVEHAAEFVETFTHPSPTELEDH